MKKRIAILGIAALLGINAVLLVVQPGFALPRALGSYFFGPRLVRADVVVNDGAIREFRLDQGRLLRKDGTSLLLREAGGTVVTVPVAPGAAVLVNGQPATLSALRRGMRVLTVREGGAPATEVRARSA